MMGPLHRRTWTALRSRIDGLHQHGLTDPALDAKLVAGYQASVSGLLGARANEVGWAPSTSYSMNLLALMFKDLSGGGKVITSEDEFPASTVAWQHHGFELCRVPSRSGRIEIADLLERVDGKTVAVVLSAVQAASGFRSDIARLGGELERLGVPFIVNATQGLGAFPISVTECKITALSASTHKWLGAGLAGAIFYLNEELQSWLKWPLAGWRPLPSNNAVSTLIGYPPLQSLEAITHAVDVVREIGVPFIASRIHELSGSLADRIQALGIPLLTPRDRSPGHLGSQNSGIVSLRAQNPRAWVESLQSQDILCSERDGYLRFGVHYFNNAQDIERLTEAFERALKTNAVA
jgi:selenocysteine lyase/cysteine desulfurase